MNNFSNLEARLEETYILVSAEIKKYLSTEELLLLPFRDALLYSSLAQGKMIRPFLCLTWGGALNANREDCLKIATSIELIHVYSLIHDDLPAMDDDDLRRGKPTLHKQYNEAIAILAGDALQAKAFEIIATLKTKNLAQIVLEFSKAIGLNGMVGGQYLDIEFEHSNPTKEDVILMQKLKTGKLIELSCILPTLLVDTSKQEQDLVRLYAGNLGAAFQIRDDFLDLWGDEKMLGKAVSKDRCRKKGSLISIASKEEAIKLLASKVTQCEVAISQFIKNVAIEELRELATYLATRSK